MLWSEALDLLRSAPLTGVGPGRFRETSPTALADRDALWAHNEYLEVAAETGVPGLILLVMLVLWAFARLWPTAADPRSVPPSWRSAERRSTPTSTTSGISLPFRSLSRL